MTIICPTINVTPAPTGVNITATSIIPSVSTCQAACSLTVSITWTNTGDTSGTFTPGVQVDSETPMTLASETLVAGASVTHAFSITGLPEGLHQICPVPN